VGNAAPSYQATTPAVKSSHSHNSSSSKKKHHSNVTPRLSSLAKPSSSSSSHPPATINNYNNNNNNNQTNTTTLDTILSSANDQTNNEDNSSSYVNVSSATKKKRTGGSSSGKKKPTLLLLSADASNKNENRSPETTISSAKNETVTSANPATATAAQPFPFHTPQTMHKSPIRFPTATAMTTTHQTLIRQQQLQRQQQQRTTILTDSSETMMMSRREKYLNDLIANYSKMTAQSADMFQQARTSLSASSPIGAVNNYENKQSMSPSTTHGGSYRLPGGSSRTQDKYFIHYPVVTAAPATSALSTPNRFVYPVSGMSTSVGTDMTMGRYNARNAASNNEVGRAGDSETSVRANSYRLF
jgi:hypothetical protein